VRSLFAAGYGYPMYDPMTVSKVPTTITFVADVEVLSEFVFGFIYVLNTFLPSDHPYNQGNMIPSNPFMSRRSTVTEYFPRGVVITSKGIRSLEI